MPALRVSLKMILVPMASPAVIPDRVVQMQELQDYPVREEFPAVIPVVQEQMQEPLAFRAVLEALEASRAVRAVPEESRMVLEQEVREGKHLPSRPAVPNRSCSNLFRKWRRHREQQSRTSSLRMLIPPSSNWSMDLCRAVHCRNRLVVSRT